MFQDFIVQIVADFLKSQWAKNSEISIIMPLDNVVHYFATKQGSRFAVKYSELEKETANIVNQQASLNEILEKLQTDGFIKLYEADSMNEKSVTLTFEGKFHYLNGGYVQQVNDKNELRDLSRRTFYLTFMIAVGTVVAAVYYFLEIIRKH